MSRTVSSERDLYRVNEAAERLGVSRETIYRLIASGDLESVKIGAARRISHEAITRFVTTLESSGKPDEATA